MSHGEWKSKAYVGCDCLYRQEIKAEQARYNTPAKGRKRMDLYWYCRACWQEHHEDTKWNNRYQELAFDVNCITQALEKIIPIAIGAWGSTSKDARTLKEKLEISDIIGSAHLSAILCTGHILREVLAEVWHNRTQ